MSRKENITKNSLPVALTVAGSDSGGGAGIQADLKTFSALETFGTSVITAVTAQNLNGVTGVQAIEPEIVQKQLLAVLNGFDVKAIKTGMLFSSEIIQIISEILSKEKHRHLPLVIDPVFAATSGSKLILDNAINDLKSCLFPLAALITPNMPEAEILTGLTLETPGDLEKAAWKLVEMFNVPALMKGGHLEGIARDVLCDGNEIYIHESKTVKHVNNHGSGCTLASAIAAFLARGMELKEAVKQAKNYIRNALEKNVSISPGLNVIHHFHECYSGTG